MFYYINNDNDIQKLKENLMSDYDETKADVSSARQAINEKLGKVFEKNIRYILEMKHEFKSVSHPDKIFMKKIKIYNNNHNPEEYEILQNEEIEVIIKGKNFKVFYDNEHNVLIRDNKDNEISRVKSKDSNKETELTINKTKLEIFRYTEFSVDGYFSMNNFRVKLFDEKEVDIIYSNINEDEEKNFINSIIEVKLNKKKINKLRDQIRKDHHYLTKIGIQNAVVLGFINSSKMNCQANSFKSLKNKKFVIYGIRNSLLDGKEIINPIDWDLDKKVDSITNELKIYKPKIDELYQLKPKIDEIYQLKPKIDEIYQLIPKIEAIYDYIIKNEKKENEKEDINVIEDDEEDINAIKKSKDKSGKKKDKKLTVSKEEIEEEEKSKKKKKELKEDKLKEGIIKVLLKKKKKRPERINEEEEDDDDNDA